MIFRTLSLLSLLLLFLVDSLQAAVKLPSIFGDHMVLQEDQTLPVWGTADPAEAVTVTVGAQSAQTKADAAGKWRVNLTSLPVNATPVTLTVAGKSNTVTFTDVLVGEVWICSGQSNMEFNLGGGKFGFGGASNADTMLPLANDPQLRLFVVAKKTSLTPLDDVGGKWELCTPESAGKFSAVGYFFGRDLRDTLKKPVGLIATYWGGTPAQAWTSLPALKKDPMFKGYVDAYEKTSANFAQASIDFPAKMTDYQTRLAAWKKDVQPSYDAEVKTWNDAALQAQSAGQAPPPKPKPSTPMPASPVAADGGKNGIANLYNGMIAPLIPFAIKGVIWYQGEANGAKGIEYRTLFPTMITDWRTRWAEGDFPFLYVQLAAYSASTIQNWPYLREAQLMTLSLPKTGMATAIDIGSPTDIHPKDKEDVGNRLALAARHVAYGENVVYSGPLYQSMKIEGGNAQVTFTQGGSGLVIGKAPWVTPGLAPLQTDKLLGFTLAGEDKVWSPADAKIVGDSVVVSSASVPKPVAVRYAWANNPSANLYNKEGLPASSFRSDDWPEPAADGTAPPAAPAPSAPPQK